MLKTMKKHLLSMLGALLLAGCATWNQPLEEAGDGVYYAESPPDYVYVGSGLSYSWAYPWIGPPYLYPMTFYSPYLYFGSRWHYPPFGIPDYWAMSPYAWHGPAAHAYYGMPVHGAPNVRPGGAGRAGREPVYGRYVAGDAPQLRAKDDGVRRLEPTTRPIDRAQARTPTSAPVMRASAPPRSRPSRTMRPAPAPRPTMRGTRRDID
jgi:hypothetical protein